LRDRHKLNNEEVFESHLFKDYLVNFGITYDIVTILFIKSDTHSLAKCQKKLSFVEVGNPGDNYFWHFLLMLDRGRVGLGKLLQEEYAL
jgi:hypothetical protein